MDLVEQLLEQVEAAVDVANPIGAPPAWTRGTTLPSRSEIEHLCPLSPIRGQPGNNIQTGLITVHMLKCS